MKGKYWQARKKNNREKQKNGKTKCLFGMFFFVTLFVPNNQTQGSSLPYLCNPLVPLGVKGQIKNTTTANYTIFCGKKVKIFLYHFSIKFASFSHFL